MDAGPAFAGRVCPSPSTEQEHPRGPGLLRFLGGTGDENDERGRVKAFGRCPSEGQECLTSQGSPWKTSPKRQDLRSGVGRRKPGERGGISPLSTTSVARGGPVTPSGLCGLCGHPVQRDSRLVWTPQCTAAFEVPLAPRQEPSRAGQGSERGQDGSPGAGGRLQGSCRGRWAEGWRVGGTGAEPQHMVAVCLLGSERV